MKQSKYFIQSFLANESMYHGGVGCVDIEKILSGNGYQPINFPYHDEFHFSAKFKRILYLVKTLIWLPPDSIVVFQFDVYARVHGYLLRLLLLRKSITLICIVIDIDGIKDGDQILLEKNINFLKKFKNFIVHNQSMEKWLLLQVPQSRVSVLEFFDFLTDSIINTRKKSFQIDFAGNLEKSTFLNGLDKVKSRCPQLTFTLYGEGIKNFKNLPSGVIYKGVYKPNELPKQLNGSFGLVWDGDAVEKSGGALGNYIRFISPHKFSLYIVSGLPVIAHHDAACAQLISKYKIGFTVSSLFEIEDEINALTEDEYSSMQGNCYALATSITTGKRLLYALNELQ